MSVIGEEAGFPIIAEIIAQVRDLMISLLTVTSVNGYVDHCRKEKSLFSKCMPKYKIVGP
jgi:hypothetical protein